MKKKILKYIKERQKKKEVKGLRLSYLILRWLLIKMTRKYQLASCTPEFSIAMCVNDSETSLVVTAVAILAQDIKPLMVLLLFLCSILAQICQICPEE